MNKTEALVCSRTKVNQIFFWGRGRAGFGAESPKPGRTRMSDSNECLGGSFCLGSVSFGSAVARRFGKFNLSDERQGHSQAKSKAEAKPCGSGVESWGVGPGTGEAKP